MSNSSAFLTSFSFTLEIKRLVKVVHVLQRHVAAKIKGNLLNYLSSTTMCYHVQSRIVKTDVLRQLLNIEYVELLYTDMFSR